MLKFTNALASSLFVAVFIVSVANAQPSEFMIFFDFNRAQPTNEALQVAQQAARVLKPTSLVVIEGHSDGAEGTSLAISIARAEAIAKAFVDLGVNRARLSVTGVGNRKPLVPTDPGVREPQNRFVKVSIQN
jgi:outer membrane protein OmpA-like peptidoglycan-associated protein